MLDRDKYNGWTNYETWLANLHYDGAWQDDAEELIEQLSDDHEDAEELRAAATESLAGTIKEAIEADAEEVLRGRESGFFADLINAGLRVINYDEIAAAYVEGIELPTKE